MLVLGNLRIDLDTYQVMVGEWPVRTSAQEFDLLLELARGRDRIVPAEALCEFMWRTTDRQMARRLAVIVCRLRNKLEGSSPYQLRTQRGRGYGLITQIGSQPPARRPRERRPDSSQADVPQPLARSAYDGP